MKIKNAKTKSDMTFSHETNDGILNIRLDGDLIGESSGLDIMEIAISGLEEGVVNCIVNLSNVRYINSSGVGVLITLLTKFRNQGGEIVLVNPSEHVTKLLVIIKLKNIFKITLTEDEALELIKN